MLLSVHEVAADYLLVEQLHNVVDATNFQVNPLHTCAFVSLLQI